MRSKITRIAFPLAVFSAAVPFCALIVSYILSASNGNVPWCMPLFEGCTSISKAARQDVSLTLFRSLMLPAALIIALFWISAEEWLISKGEDRLLALRSMRFLGILAAIFLAIYVIFLGTQGKTYFFMRRFGVIVYFAGSGMAQLLFLWSLDRLSAAGISSIQLLKTRLSVILIIMLGLALAQAPATLLLESDWGENIIEWNFAILMHLFYVFTAISWARIEPESANSELGAIQR